MAGVDLNNTTLRDINSQKDSLLNEVQNNYNNQTNQATQKYNELIQASKNYAQQQSNIQQQQTNQTIKEINQNKAQAQKDYTKEQKGAYADYAAQTNDYGVNAEKQAAAGLQNSGYSESSKVNLYNTYQNRYVAARDSYNLAVQNYDNQIAKAQIANSSALAEIAYNALQTQLKTAIEGFQYQNELLNNLTTQKVNINSTYQNMWQSQYQTLLNEAQYNEDMAFKKAEAEREQANWQKEYDLSQAQFAFQKSQAAKSSSGGSSGGSSKLTDSSGGSAQLTNTAAVNTAYYQGDLNPDAKNGTFSNGYQPNNVNGNKLSKSGDTITFNTNTLSGQKQTVTQTIWKTKDGTKYYWDGRENQYKKVK